MDQAAKSTQSQTGQGSSLPRRHVDAARDLASGAELSLRDFAQKLLQESECGLSPRARSLLQRALSLTPLDIGLTLQNLKDFGEPSPYRSYRTSTGLQVAFDVENFQKKIVAPKIEEYVDLIQGTLTDEDWDGMVMLAQSLVPRGLTYSVLEEGKGLQELFSLCILTGFMAHPAFLKSPRAADVLEVLCDAEDEITQDLFFHLRYVADFYKDNKAEGRVLPGCTLAVLHGVEAILKNRRVRSCWVEEIKTGYITGKRGEVVGLLASGGTHEDRRATLPARVALLEFSLLWSEQSERSVPASQILLKSFGYQYEFDAVEAAGMKVYADQINWRFVQRESATG